MRDEQSAVHPHATSVVIAYCISAKVNVGLVMNATIMQIHLRMCAYRYLRWVIPKGLSWGSQGTASLP